MKINTKKANGFIKVDGEFEFAFAQGKKDPTKKEVWLIKHRRPSSEELING